VLLSGFIRLWFIDCDHIHLDDSPILRVAIMVMFQYAAMVKRTTPIFRNTHLSMDWFKGKSTGNHGFSHQIWCFPVNFPLNQSIENPHFRCISAHHQIGG
jgi:hypothetical protein